MEKKISGHEIRKIIDLIESVAVTRNKLKEDDQPTSTTQTDPAAAQQAWIDRLKAERNQRAQEAAKKSQTEEEALARERQKRMYFATLLINRTINTLSAHGLKVRVISHGAQPDFLLFGTLKNNLKINVFLNFIMVNEHNFVIAYINQPDRQGFNTERVWYHLDFDADNPADFLLELGKKDLPSEFGRLTEETITGINWTWADRRNTDLFGIN